VQSKRELYGAVSEKGNGNKVII